MIRVVGVGNELRGDDAAGLLTVRSLRALGPAGMCVEESAGDLARLIEILTGDDDVVIVDSCRGHHPGEVVLVTEAELETLATSSSHGLGVGEALGIARALGTRTQVHLWAIAGRDFAIGDPVSDEVQQASRLLAARIARTPR